MFRLAYVLLLSRRQIAHPGILRVNGSISPYGTPYMLRGLVGGVYIYKQARGTGMPMLGRARCF